MTAIPAQVAGVPRLAICTPPRKDGSVNYVDGANISGFVKVADAMLAQGTL